MGNLRVIEVVKLEDLQSLLDLDAYIIFAYNYVFYYLLLLANIKF